MLKIVANGPKIAFVQFKIESLNKILLYQLILRIYWIYRNLKNYYIIWLVIVIENNVEEVEKSYRLKLVFKLQYIFVLNVSQKVFPTVIERFGFC